MILKITDPRYPQHNWHVQSSGMKILLGLDPKAKLPVEGMPAREIQGITVWVEPLKGAAPTHGKRHAHRVMARCPVCSHEMSAGRLHQHVCKQG